MSSQINSADIYNNKKHYFDEKHVSYLFFSKDKKKQEEQIKYFNLLNEGVINKKLPYYMDKFNLKVDSRYENELREELKQEILLNQLSQLSERYSQDRSLFSYLTQIAENVIKYKVQNLVRETNHVISFYSVSKKDDIDVDDYESMIDQMVLQHSNSDIYSDTHQSTFDKQRLTIRMYSFTNIPKHREMVMNILKELQHVFGQYDENSYISFISTLYNRYLESLELYEKTQNPEIVLSTIITINKFIILSFKNIFKYKRKYIKKQKQTAVKITDVLKLTKYLDNICKMYFKLKVRYDINRVIRFEPKNYIDLEDDD